MEDVLAVYSRPYDKEYPVICMDEKSVQLFANAHKSLRSKDGRIEYEDNEYIRNGTACILDSRITTLWIQELNTKKIVLVMDSLNTHTIAALYQTFPPQEAFRIASRLEIHYTPKHKSWLDIAEIELSALARQYIGKNRIPNLETLRYLLQSWYAARNKK